MTPNTLRAGLLALAALLAACGQSLPPTLTEAPGNPPVDPDLPLPPKMRCAPGVSTTTTLAQADDCASTTRGRS